MTLFDQVSYKWLVSDGTSFRLCEGIQAFKIPDGSQRIQLDVPKTMLVVSTQPRASREAVAHRLSGTLKASFTLSAFLDIPFTRHVRTVSLTLRPKKSILPSASFSSCCCNASNLAFSSTILSTSESLGHATWERSLP